MLKNFILKLLYSGQAKDVAGILTNDKSRALLDYEKN